MYIIYDLPCLIRVLLLFTHSWKSSVRAETSDPRPVHTTKPSKRLSSTSNGWTKMPRKRRRGLRALLRMSSHLNWSNMTFKYSACSVKIDNRVGLINVGKCILYFGCTPEFEHVHYFLHIISRHSCLNGMWVWYRCGLWTRDYGSFDFCFRFSPYTMLSHYIHFMK